MYLPFSVDKIYSKKFSRLCSWNINRLFCGEVRHFHFALVITINFSIVVFPRCVWTLAKKRTFSKYFFIFKGFQPKIGYNNLEFRKFAQGSERFMLIRTKWELLLLYSNYFSILSFISWKSFVSFWVVWGHWNWKSESSIDVQYHFKGDSLIGFYPLF